MTAMVATLVTAACLLSACQRGQPHNAEDEGMGLFSRKEPLEAQLEQLEAAGIRTNPGVGEADLLVFKTREQLETKPYDGLIEVLATDLEREPHTPIADRLWLCDYERIEDHGDYASVLVRLERMTGNALGIDGLDDYVDVEGAEAWIQFNLRGNLVRWDFRVEDDWLDPVVFVKYDALLQRYGGGLRLYANYTDYGQLALVGAFRRNEKAKFDALSRVRMIAVSLQH